MGLRIADCGLKTVTFEEQKVTVETLLEVAYAEIDALKDALRKAWREREAALALRHEAVFDFQAIQRRAILAALEVTSYNQVETARLCGISRGKLNYMLREMGVKHEKWRVHKHP